MAKPPCTMCEQFEGLLMMTNLDDGDTQVICVPDLPAFALGMAAGVTQGLTPDEAEAYGDAFDQLAQNDTRVKRYKRSAARTAPPAANGQVQPTDLADPIGPDDLDDPESGGPYSGITAGQ